MGSEDKELGGEERKVTPIGNSFAVELMEGDDVRIVVNGKESSGWICPTDYKMSVYLNRRVLKAPYGQY